MVFSSDVSDNSGFLFNEASSIVEPNLHALFHNLADRDYILRYCWNMQYILDVCLFALFTEWDIVDMLNGVYCVIPSFNTARSIGFSTQTSCDLTHLNRQNTSLELTVLVEHDLVIEFSTIYMSHHEHFATIIVGIRGVICELPVCECRLTFLFSTLRFVVAEFSTISALDGIVLSTWSC